MKVVLAIPYNPLEEIGGLEISTLRLAGALKSLGQDVRIITKGRSGFAKGVSIEGYQDMAAICDWLNKNYSQFDVVDWMEIFPEPGEISMQCAVSEKLRRRGKKTFLTIATLGNLEKRGSGDLVKRLIRQTMDGYVAMTGGQLKEFSDYGIEENVFPIGFGIDTEKIYCPASVDEKKALRKKLGLPEDAVLFLFIGRLVGRKRPDFLLETWRGLSDIHSISHLVMIGSGFGQHDSIESKVIELASGCDHLIRREMAFDLDPKDYYKACDAFVVTSEREGMPNVIMEAMACGIPVISSGIPGIGELIANGVNGLVFPIDDGKMLSQAIRILAFNEKLRIRLGSAARMAIVDKKDTLKVAQEYVGIFENGRVG
ncbi:MAG: glycosyltransferase family 4 protein [Candidatus Paceibacterota bacterium]|jgi:glycosyltransferase involved in cell wall biosynthesis